MRACPHRRSRSPVRDWTRPVHYCAHWIQASRRCVVRVLPIAKISTSPKPAKCRLAEALATITSTAFGSAPRPTISALCRLAGVSRNTLYRYYPDIAKAVRHFGGRNGKRARLARQKALAALRSEVSLLRGQLAQMATLA